MADFGNRLWPILVFIPVFQPEGRNPQGCGPEGWAPKGGGAPKGGAPKGGAPKGGAPKGGAPKGGAPKGGPRRVGHRRVGPRRVGAQNFALFLPFPATVSFFLCLSGCLLVEFWWCLKCRGPEMCTFGVLGLSCASPGGPVWCSFYCTGCGKSQLLGRSLASFC